NPGALVVSLLYAETAPWGIVTNGKLWRLYSAKAHSRATNYYEIDLEETLASPDPAEAFRYFYLFFRAEAYVRGMETPATTPVRSDEVTFLDALLEESNTYARELGDRLKERVFEQVFPHFAAGFIHALGGPQKLLSTPEGVRSSRLQSAFNGTLTFLYRLLFLLYAESRDLLPVREVRGYQPISLQHLKEEIAAAAGPLEDQAPENLKSAYNNESTALYDRLLALFEVIDQGSAARNVPAYNGGLFMTDPHPDADGTDVDGTEAQAARFLKQTKLPDRYLALGLDLMTRDVDARRGDLGLIDYKSLGVRQLGSIYEGLLEFKLRIATEGGRVDEGGESLTPGQGAAAQDGILKPGTVYLENDRRERKATGSYYTPDYIVKYIVRQTVGPVMDEKLEALRPRLHQVERDYHRLVKRKRELENVTPDEPRLLSENFGDVLHALFEIKILDPAMGSGHFLVEAVDYVTDRLVRFTDGFPFLSTFFEGMRRSILDEMKRQNVVVNPNRLTDVTLLKRHVLKRCVYGVDLNPMAVELAKVSLWLDCFTLGAPLSFLDHHLRTGNSLIGAMAQELDEGTGSGGQMAMFTGPFTGLLRAAEIMRGVSRLTDVTLAQVQESGKLFEAFDQQAKPFKQLLDLHVAQYFGVERAAEFLTSHSQDDALAMLKGQSDIPAVYQDALAQARALYEEKRFFHWDLEFPEVFIDLENTKWKDDGGFDAVVGNPPYGIIFDTDDKSFLEKNLSSFIRNNDIFTAFSEKVIYLIRSTGLTSMIVPNTFIMGPYFNNLKQFWIENAQVVFVDDLGYRAVFDDPNVFSAIFLCTKKNDTINEKTLLRTVSTKGKEIDYSDVQQVTLSNLPLERWKPYKIITRKVSKVSLDIGSLFFVKDVGLNYWTKGRGKSRGGAISERVLYDGKRKSPADHSYLKGSDFYRFEIPDYGHHWLRHDYRDLLDPEIDTFRFSPDYLDIPIKIVYRQTADEIAATLDESHSLVDKTVHVIVEKNKSSEYDYQFILAVLNSNLIDYIYADLSNEEGRVFAQVKTFRVKKLPIRRIHFTTPEPERERLTADLITLYNGDEHETLLAKVESLLPMDENGEILAFQDDASGAEEKSDVVHDLLAHLAEQMIAMNKTKQARVESFWADLESVTAPADFEELRNRGKWEKSLSSAACCRPYVDAESRSTKHIDESLGWDEDCFHAFAAMLIGKSSLTPKMTAVYREHHSAYKSLVE
ncbi:MAG: TaqI-like C-terminal specificity domain-containing protein, partial [Chloroflexota bacterium]|nr:TaqI-like C-terminal specificity domain-containing protein [Chloroflexota bacterium]